MLALCKAYSPLRSHLINAQSGKKSIDFSKPDAVLALNTALLVHYYGIKHWQIPTGYLCPPVPGRADYIHGIADLLSMNNNGAIPQGDHIKGLDIGIGANAIYPIIGIQTYGWRFVGSDIDPISVESASILAQKNPSLAPLLEVRMQNNSDDIFAGVIQANERFTFCLCNPPFHKSRADAMAGNQRKAVGLQRNQRKARKQDSAFKPKPGTLNFAGTANELWCVGGEMAFIQRMISQSVDYKTQFDWFTCLVSKSDHLKALETSIRYYGASDYRKVNMGQGQKQSRFIAWTFQ